MGNHAAGQAVGLAAEFALQTRKPGDTALSLLDRACKKYRDCDAEFESEDPDNPGSVHPEYGQYTDPHPKAALGMLMVEAFSPNGLADLPLYADMMGTDKDDDGEAEDAAYELWAENVYSPFRNRYGFC